MDPAGLGNPALVQQLTDYLQQDLGFSDAESQYLAEEFADGLQQLSEVTQGDSDSSSNGTDSSGSDVQGSGAEDSDAGSAPGTDTPGNSGGTNIEDKPLEEDEGFFWGTVVALTALMAGALGAAAAAIIDLLTVISAAIDGAAASVGSALASWGQRLANLVRSGGAAAPEVPAVEGEGAAVVEDAAALANKLHHIFDKSEHALDSLVEQFGSQLEAYNNVQKAANQALQNGQLTPNANGILPTGNAGNIIEVAGTQVRLIGGWVHDGVVEIATFSRKGL